MTAIDGQFVAAVRCGIQYIRLEIRFLETYARPRPSESAEEAVS